MRTTNKGQAELLFLAVLAIGAVALLSPSILQPQVMAGGSGMQVLSLSQTQFLTDDPQLNGQAWLLTVVQNGLGQQAVGTFCPATGTCANKVSTSDSTITKDFTLSASSEKQECQYSIQNTYNSIYHMELYKTNVQYVPLAQYGGCDVWGDFDRCKARSTVYTFVAYKSPFSLTTECDCFYTTTSGVYGKIRTPSLVFDSKLSMKLSDGSVAEGHVKSTSQSSVWLGDKALATWAGNLVSGEQCPIAADERVAVAYTDGKWKIINDLAYANYNTYYTSGMATCLTLIQSGSSTAEQCRDRFNSYSSNALQSTAFTSPTGGSTATVSGTETNGQVIMSLNKQIQYPVITLHIKASWIGVQLLIGKPQIVSLSVQPFATGDTGFIVATVKNTGSQTGSFAAIVTCDPPIIQSGTEQRLDVAPNSQSVVNIPITATTSEEITKSCRVRVYDRSQPNNYDEKSVSVTVKSIVLCPADNMRCNGKVIERCNKAGSGWDTVGTCEYECVAKSDTLAECKSGGGVVEECQCTKTCNMWDIGCQIDCWFYSNISCPAGNWWSTYSFALIVIAILVFVLWLKK